MHRRLRGFLIWRDLDFFPFAFPTVYLPLLESNAAGSKGQYHRSLQGKGKFEGFFLFFFLPQEGKGREGNLKIVISVLVCFLFNELSEKLRTRGPMN